MNAPTIMYLVLFVLGTISFFACLFFADKEQTLDDFHASASTGMKWNEDIACLDRIYHFHLAMIISRFLSGMFFFSILFVPFMFR